VDDGPSMEQYVETRLNLLTEAIKEMDRVMRERIDRLATGIDQRFQHTDKMSLVVQDGAMRAIDKAENAQQAHNVASNEWRSTLNDFKNTLISRQEFDRLERDFSAYRLEMSRLFAADAGSKQAVKETKDDSKSLWALVVSIAAAGFLIFGTLTTAQRMPTATAAATSDAVTSLTRRVDELIAKLPQR